MLLLEFKNGEFHITKDLINDDRPYAILSHTWGDDDDEVTFRDLAEGTGKTKPGYRKIRFCGQQAARDNLHLFWVDTCCIDKSNNAELSEAINSMFRWYQNAVKCYVYLSDMTINNLMQINDSLQWDWDEAFRKCKWFARGWTLQELVAPPSVEFFSSEGKRLGDKKSLERQIHEITGIAVQALRGTALTSFSVAERMSWAEARRTKREEDKAYSLLGIFDVFMSPIYGEGQQHASNRLRRKIHKRISEQGQPVPQQLYRGDSGYATLPSLKVLEQSSYPADLSPLTLPALPAQPVKRNHQTVFDYMLED
ncbi:hypothetical protein MMC11_005835 [Xylographa trunciseda]|nr:hypothetical protein [Xylographa trunciseda]